MLDNIILLTDSYKTSHWKMYPPLMTKMYSYFESRGGDFEKTIFFGAQYYIKRYLAKKITTQDLEKAKVLINKHMQREICNEDGWRYIIDKYDGILPLTIKTVPEGTIVPTSNVLMTIENNDSELGWLTNYIETILSQVWYPCTVATQSYYMKQTILDFLRYNGSPESIDFKLHDFGFRGVTCPEQAAIGGASHLLNFKGTDTLAGIELIYDYYNPDDMPGFSIPASEHSTITVWGRENEDKAIANILEQFPDGLVACVSDSYNIFSCCNKIYGEELKDKILSRDGCLIIRPDSGDPTVVLPKVLEILGNRFGFTVNNKKHKVLNDKVRIIQGDGIDRHSLNGILYCLKSHGWSADNIAFGSGGGLLQKLNRDTSKYAFKCSYAEVDDKQVEVYKDPITDPGKTSKKGKLSLIKNNGKFETVKGFHDDDLLRTVYHNGYVFEENFETIRSRISNV